MARDVESGDIKKNEKEAASMEQALADAVKVKDKLLEALRSTTK